MKNTERLLKAAENYHNAQGDVGTFHRGYRGFIAGARWGYDRGHVEALQLAIKIVETNGYTVAYNKTHQPWSGEANRWLSAQRLYVADKIRELLKNRGELK